MYIMYRLLGCHGSPSDVEKPWVGLFPDGPSNRGKGCKVGMSSVVTTQSIPTKKKHAQLAAPAQFCPGGLTKLVWTSLCIFPTTCLGEIYGNGAET